jgi:serine/threonine protein kinase
MTSSNHLRSIGVTVYQIVEDVPYIRDDSRGSFKGSYGTVYRATRPSTRPFVGKEEVYAIKEIQAVSAEDQLKVAQEVKFLQQFRHPNILELEEAFILDIPGHRMLHTIRLVTKP